MWPEEQSDKDGVLKADDGNYTVHIIEFVAEKWKKADDDDVDKDV